MRAHIRSLAVALMAGALAMLPVAAHAYQISGAGGKLGVTSPEDFDQTVLISGHLEMENQTRLHLMPNLMYWHVDRTSDVNPNFDVYYDFGNRDRATPFVGGGLGLNLRSSSISDRSRTDLGANMIGGVRFPSGANHYFVEGRYTASDVPQVAVLGGITFHTR